MTISDLLNSHTTDLSWQESLYQKLHQIPELSGREEKTAALIRAELNRFDCEVISPIGGFGMVAIFRNGDGPCVLMRADFDGLPVKETTGVAYASTHTMTVDNNLTACMHACGHDMHTTSLLGACALLDAHRSMWRGTFIALFQPSEENGEGAAAMVADGLQEKIPVPDVCFGQHIVPGPAGKVMTLPGPILAACDSIEVTITGQSAHGSMPQNALDPTYAAAMIVVRLQGIVGREISPHDFAVASVGTLESGNSNNTIPGKARIVINCRHYSQEVKTKLYTAIERVCEAECVASGMTVKPVFRYFGHAPLTNNSLEVFNRVRTTFDDVFHEDSTDAHRWTASEDFSHIPNAFNAPYLFWLVGCTPRKQWAAALAADTIDSNIPTNHSGDFLPDYQPTVTACTQAALAAVLTYLAP
ncbi:Metal-dependentamidase/aminoacylase/carboxypeptidase [Corynebacterium kutscheri]|uniref:Amidohydrolase n=1 Tax=Corynebacterium kutscheri TaxID=35755 RepID=A0A0F6R043_9CORY|nr:amidohydrolase [Corynebacterium kutscheri]AKE41507.1 amidohydrolase [Corynebacterium kutscheri]VEH08785.1 Metal-dependentamidase/aminoacylase/carboxypeptidase [Corynebacterium kutscheri]VEH09831.1 Metal-dependentamidase/aminoacylase/carboxypeptidase [Corynebacterium kutscheri]VEH79914.1 Metal-dependentamidase/aminoacylase/carboxypeptidase [Corynebacterium kutscheri]